MKYRLRAITKADIPEINQWRNDKEVMDLLGNNFLYISEDLDKLWFENYLNNRNLAIRLAIVQTVEKLVIGTVQLTSIHEINRSAEFSILIGDKNYWAQGAGSFATQEILLHGFKNLNLNRIYLTVLEHNFRAIKLYERFGFVREGIKREAIFKNGVYCNLIEMSILRKDYSY
jgi:RimJ/RimL family protein N-acetyltransferase